MISEKLLEVKEYNETGYAPVIDYCTWRVAVLNYHDELLPENIYNMQRHDETDEVFVLLSGKCILYIGEGNEKVDSISTIEMLPLKIYNIKKRVWHNHSLNRNGKVLIVENVDTEDNINSPYIKLTEEQMEYVRTTGNKLL